MTKRMRMPFIFIASCIDNLPLRQFVPGTGGGRRNR